jgi:hypothetical protein
MYSPVALAAGLLCLPKGQHSCLIILFPLFRTSHCANIQTILKMNHQFTTKICQFLLQDVLADLAISRQYKKM